MTTTTETALATIETISAVDLFKPGALDPILDRLEAEVREQASRLDISTEAGRKAIASLSYKVGRSKTFIDSQRKALVANEKKRLAVIDKEGRRAWDKIESLQEEVRKPLTDWEQAEETRLAEHEEALKAIAELANPPFGTSAEEIGRRLDDVDAYSGRVWQEFQRRFDLAHQAATTFLAKLYSETKKSEDDKAEFERMKAEQLVREQAERDATIKAEAAASAKAHAEAEAARKAQEIAQAEAREREAVERQRMVAEERAQAAEREAARLVAQVAQDKAEAERREIERAAEVEAAQKRAVAQAAAEQAAAIERERARAAEEKRSAEEAEAKREANKKHCAKINRLALVALMEIEGLEISEENARLIIAAIAKGTIPAVRISY